MKKAVFDNACYPPEFKLYNDNSLLATKEIPDVKEAVLEAIMSEETDMFIRVKVAQKVNLISDLFGIQKIIIKEK